MISKKLIWNSINKWCSNNIGYLKDKVRTLIVDRTDIITAPFVYTLPNQLIAYHIALLKGTDVDQPRNLAKSVTVE